MKPVIVAVTVDVENPQTPLFRRRFTDNRIWADGHGIERIMDILERFGLTGTLFTNVYEQAVWGKSEMARLVSTMAERGHEVELHTHPIWMDDQRRENMYQFPLAEQSALVDWGAGFIERHSGRRPVCHRAGAYGFNLDTLRACRLAGLKVDSSNFYGHEFCRATLTRQTPVTALGVVEAPVTYFLREGRIVKTDLDWMGPEEFWGFYDTVASSQDLWFINLFLHSYSLLQHEDDFASWRPSPEKESRLASLLEGLAGREDCRMAPLSHLVRRDDIGPSAVPGTGPEAAPKRNPEPGPGQARAARPPAAPPSKAAGREAAIGKVLLVTELPLNEKALLSLREQHPAAGAQWVFCSFDRAVAESLKRSALEVLDLRDLGHHFYMDHKGWTSIYPEQPRHYEAYARAMEPVVAMPEVSQCRGHDLYAQPDYNEAHTVGLQLFHLIDLAEAVLNEVEPDLAICLGTYAEAKSATWVVLRHMCARLGPRFQPLSITSKGAGDRP